MLLTPLGTGATIACSLLLKACQLVSDGLAGASAGSGSKSHKILPAEGACIKVSLIPGAEISSVSAQ